MIMKRFLFILAFAVSTINCFCQNRVTFLVTDAESAEALPNVSIIAKGDAIHTVTNNNGKATALVANGKIDISFSSVGYKPQTITISFPLANNDSVYAIAMEKE